MCLNSMFKRFKIRSTDVIFMVIMCVILYFVYGYEFKKINNETKEKKARQLESKKEEFFKLRKSCANGDKSACDKLNEG